MRIRKRLERMKQAMFIRLLNTKQILRISLYVVDDFLDPEKKLSNEVAYGSGVRINKLYGKANVEEVMDFEMEKRVGRMLVTGM